MRLDDIAREFRRDELIKQVLLTRAARHVPAFDAAEMSAAEVARAVLNKLKIEVGADPVQSLKLWLDGFDNAAEHERQERTPGALGAGMDSSGADFVTRYINAT